MAEKVEQKTKTTTKRTTTRKVAQKKAKTKYAFKSVKPYLYVPVVNVQFIEGKYETDNEEIANQLRVYPSEIKEVE